MEADFLPLKKKVIIVISRLKLKFIAPKERANYSLSFIFLLVVVLYPYRWARYTGLIKLSLSIFRLHLIKIDIIQ